MDIFERLFKWRGNNYVGFGTGAVEGSTEDDWDNENEVSEDEIHSPIFEPNTEFDESDDEEE